MTRKDKHKAEAFASKFKTEMQQYAARVAYEEAQRMQLEDDLECTKLFIRWLCIKYQLPEKEIIEQFEKDMRQ